MKYCEYPNCYKPVYGSLNTSLRYCVQHRSAGFNNDISKCRPLDCKKQAKYEVFAQSCAAHNTNDLSMAKVKNVDSSDVIQLTSPSNTKQQFCAHKPNKIVNDKDKSKYDNANMVGRSENEKIAAIAMIMLATNGYRCN
jgi:hypothetical protein